MVQVNILEQLATLFKILKTNRYVLLLSIISIFLLFILTISNKYKDKKITKIIWIIIYLGVFGTLLYFYHNDIFKLLDYLMDNIFLFLFFPNLAIYVLVLIIINGMIIKSTFSNKYRKVIKNINIIFFILFNIIFYLIIDNIVTNNINVYEQLSIYTNNDLLILIELSMKLFLVWLVTLLMIKITSFLILRISLKKQTNNHLVLDEIVDNKELETLNTIPNFVEITPTIPELSIQLDKSKVDIINSNDNLVSKNNIYNTYLDIEPIKKKSKLVSEVVTKQLEEDTSNDIQIEPSVCKEENTETYLHYLPSEEKRVPESIQPKNSYNGLSFQAFDIIENNHYDNYLSIDNETDNNMDIVFNSENNYLKSIMVDIKKLENNYEDKNQIKKIYENIKLNQNDLTLSDYNSLINMLSDIRK